MITPPINHRSRFVSMLLVLSFIFSVVFFRTDMAIAVSSSETDNPAIMGAWSTIAMPPPEERIQSVHTTLLPNGKILMVNGSSFRSTLVKGDQDYEFIEGVDPKNYDVIDNSGLYDPVTGKFERIPSPPALVYDKELKRKTTNDLFCSGHVQLANGNVLFVGGTGRYYPGGAFTGTKWLNLYNWRTGKWSNLGQMKDGRWYPTLVTLDNGKVAIFSGLRFGEPNQINPSLEIFDPETNKLQYIDLRDIPNSPFNTKVENEDVYDNIDLYPRIFPLADGRLLVTGDDAGIAGVLVPKFSKKSYVMSLETTNSGEVAVSFEVASDRPETSKAYGTALQIPNSEDVLLFGGIIGTNSISFGRGGNTEGFPPEARVATSLQHWISPEHSGTKNGKWEIVPDFLPQPRANLQAVILPDQEILVTNGGEYPEYKPIYQPLLLTPNSKAKGGYQTKSLSPAKLPRLYHNGAILLPDARVLIIGGNANRAAIEKDGTVHVDVLGDPKTFFRLADLRNKAGKTEPFDLKTFYQDPQHYYAQGDPEPFVPAEIWQGEVFSPPYLALPGDRPEIINAPETLQYGQTGVITVNNATENGSLVLNKLGSVTHSFDYGQRLVELASTVASTTEGESSLEFTAPTNAHLYPPGYYMMFYLNDTRKPSVAKMVKLKG
ncbi:MAG: galactose oxidase early set domain-containing protein [Cyanobacteria bacterium P01_G01_bin.67]